MAHDPRVVANQILELAFAAGSAVTPMQLQKLAYFSHGWCLGTAGTPLVNTPFLAWEYGPVNREIYHAFREYGGLPIKRPYLVFGFPLTSTLIEADKDIIKEVYETYGHLSGPQLMLLTHEDGTPWQQVWKDGSGRNDVISDDLSKEYFAKLAEQQAA